ncbi:hypothetical protein [Kiloniella antarctica]|uniref:Phospholipid-binding protein n=1 Tax=Kiloniella antarctica TaxID=1550907 RepID=A0ABW5BJT1_9PROT
MKKLILLSAFLGSSLTFSTSLKADDFDISFDQWGDFRKCTSGKPTRVANPVFQLSDVPTGTVKIKFSLQDLDAKSYHHGGGSVKYTDQSVIETGAFKYKSPCPPRGIHTYEWTAKAYDDAGEIIAKAKTKKKYPQ